MYSSQDVQQWKQQYPSIYLVDYEIGSFVFRQITIGEYINSIGNDSLTQSEKEELVVQYTLLYPLDFNFDEAPLGLVTGLFTEILEHSGLANHDSSREILESERQISGNIDKSMKAVIIAAMPAYKEEDLDKLTYRQLCSKVIIAEQILSINALIAAGESIAFEIPDPNQELEKQQKIKDKYIRNRRDGQPLPDDPIAQKLRMAMS